MIINIVDVSKVKKWLISERGKRIFVILLLITIFSTLVDLYFFVGTDERVKKEPKFCTVVAAYDPYVNYFRGFLFLWKKLFFQYYPEMDLYFLTENLDIRKNCTGKCHNFRLRKLYHYNCSFTGRHLAAFEYMRDFTDCTHILVMQEDHWIRYPVQRDLFLQSFQFMLEKDLDVLGICNNRVCTEEMRYSQLTDLDIEEFEKREYTWMGHVSYKEIHDDDVISRRVVPVIRGYYEVPFYRNVRDVSQSSRDLWRKKWGRPISHNCFVIKLDLLLNWYTSLQNLEMCDVNDNEDYLLLDMTGGSHEVFLKEKVGRIVSTAVCYSHGSKNQRMDNADNIDCVHRKIDVKTSSPNELEKCYSVFEKLGYYDAKDEDFHCC